MTSSTVSSSLLSSINQPMSLTPTVGGSNSEAPRPASTGYCAVTWSQAARTETCGERGWSERETLYLDFQPLVRRLIRQYGEDPELRQDLAGEIYYRFCNLLDAYDPSRGIPLRAYMVRTLTASVYTYSRSQWRRQHREVSLEADNGAPEPATVIADPSNQWDTALLRHGLNNLRRKVASSPLGDD